MLLRLILLSLAVFLFTGSKAGSWTSDWSNPKVFIENKGQFRLPWEKPGMPSEVLFGVDDGGTMIYFTRKGVSYTFFSRSKDHVVLDKSQYKTLEEYKAAKAKYKMMSISDAVHMHWKGASGDVMLEGQYQNSLTHTYSISVNGVNKEISGLRSFDQIVYKGLYPGIDVKYSFHPQTGLKYDLILWPGADASLIRMVYEGMDALSLDGKGNLKIMTQFGVMTDHAPLTYYPGEKHLQIPSAYSVNENVVSFLLGEYDKTRKLIIDPWTVTPAFPNSGKIWECEKDAAGNAYIYGGDTPMRLRKYNSTGTLQWTYNTTWDTAGYWVGTFIVDQAGNSYITSGSNGEIRKVNTGGASVWFNNPNGLFGPIYEYWHLTFNCDETVLVCGGMRAQSALSINSYRGAIMNINLNTGAIIGTPLTVGWMQGLNIKEVRTICSSPNQNYYFLTLDSIGMMTNTLTLGWKSTSNYNFAYGIPNYGVTNQGISAIRATANFIYTQNGTTLHKRNIANGAIVATVAIPGGGSSTIPIVGGNTPHNSGLDLDNCGNVYVGSTTGVHKFDANLNLLGSALTTNAVYDVAVSPSGEVLACGNGFFSSINTLAPCGVVTLTCSSNPLSISTSQTNPLCNGQCTGTATVNATGGTAPYTYTWSPSGGTNATATGLCAGVYTVTVTDAGPSTLTATVTITQPTALTSSVQSQTNVLCNGVCSGAATITASGGTGTLTYSWAPSGGTTASITGRCAGTYTCTITDANGCTRTQTVTITQPPVITASANSTPATCGNNNGTATATASGGTGTLTYAWAPSGGTNASATGLGAGVYTVTVTDANGCTMTATTTVTSSGGPTVTLNTQTNVLCNGNSTGSATVNVTGGNSPYTYAWTPSGGTTATATGLGAGTYTVTVTDASSCSQTFTVTITQPTALTATTSSTNTTCTGNTGTASVSPSGGTGPYSYSWAPGGGTNANATGLSAGTYTVTVTDANNCTFTVTAAVGTTNGPTVTLATQANVSCNGGSNGSATVSVTGGTSPYTYSWAPSGGTNATAIGLAAGTYTVTVTDANNCIQLFVVTITQPAALSITTGSTNTPCGSSTGTVSSNVTGGTGPYSYLWLPGGATTSNVSGLGAGTYTVIVTDVNACSMSATATVANLNGPSVAVTSSGNVTCNGMNNGSATVNVTGGTSPYTYVWSPSGGTSASATGLIAGTYTVTVTDANGCSNTITVTITQPAALALTLNGSNATCGNLNGSVTSSVTGGTSAYTYSWQPGGATSSGISGLGAGTYTCIVTDANGCTSSAVSIITASPGLTVLISNDTTISAGQTVLLVAAGGTSYLWSPSGGLSCITCANPVASPTTTSTYTVIVTDVNGCTGVATVTVSVLNQCGDNGVFFIPDAFSPNADLMNDVLYVRGGGISEFYFAVYDRWGEKVFESTDPNIGWDGNYKGKALDPGVFVFYCKITCYAGEEIIQKGNVTLFR
ncbi:MAG: gliding motility-associated C-terminal domain-containing protein [Bacteroidia bacterium]|nr:gliding motility-associated C-terminal domain-containing protein [Bacteroidia bacterium]